MSGGMGHGYSALPIWVSPGLSAFMAWLREVNISTKEAEEAVCRGFERREERRARGNDLSS